MCYNVWKNRDFKKEKSLNFSEQKLIIDKLSMYIKNVVFTWWEPLMNKDIFNLIKYSKDKWLMVTIITNWALLSDEKVLMLKKTWVSNIQISFHHWNKDSFNDITWTNKYYDAVRNSLIKSIDCFGNENVFINIVPNKDTYNDTFKTCTYLYNIWIRNIVVGLPVYTWSALNNKIMFSVDEVVDLYKWLVDLNENLKINMTLGTALPHCLFLDKNWEKIVKLSSWCSIWTSAIAVWVDWNIRPCIEFPMNLWSLLNNKFEEIRYGDEINKFRNNKVVPEVCINCALLEKCKWWCRLSAFNYSWKIDWMDPYINQEYIQRVAT